jgi:hypothetical protein
MENLARKYRYNESGAQAICMYVIDNELPQRFNEA